MGFMTLIDHHIDQAQMMMMIFFGITVIYDPLLILLDEHWSVMHKPMFVSTECSGLQQVGCTTNSVNASFQSSSHKEPRSTSGWCLIITTVDGSCCFHRASSIQQIVVCKKG